MLAAPLLAMVLAWTSTPSEDMARTAIGLCPGLVESGPDASVSIGELEQFGLDEIEFLSPRSPDDPLVSLAPLSGRIWALDYHWSASSGVAICTLHGPGSDQDVLRVTRLVESGGWQFLGQVGRLWQWRSGDGRYLLNVQEGDRKTIIMSVLHPLAED